ncbi:MAG: FHA domain-containing protein [Candidatus Xenobia bacterium]
MRCRDCGLDLEAGSPICPGCGRNNGEAQAKAVTETETLSDAVACPCGKVNDRSHSFCPACGARIKAGDGLDLLPPSPPAPSAPPPGIGMPAPPPVIGLPAPPKGPKMIAPPERKVIAPPVPGPKPDAPAPAPVPAAPAAAAISGPILPPAKTVPMTVPPPSTPASVAQAEGFREVVAATSTATAAPAAPGMNAKLKATRTGKVFFLDHEVTRMGRRDPAAGIEPEIDTTILDDEFFCSRRHAQISFRDGNYYLEDCGSANGSYLNNVMMAPHAPELLREGDKVRLGNVEFTFTTEFEARRGDRPVPTFAPPQQTEAAPAPARERETVRIRLDLQALETHLRTNKQRTRELLVGSFRVQLDLSSQVLGVFMPDDHGAPGEAELFPILPASAPVHLMPAGLLGHKARLFNIGLYAALKKAAQEGAGDFPGKATLLNRVASFLSSMEPGRAGNVAETIFGAMVVGGFDFEVPRPFESSVIKRVAEFLADDANAKPISFYTLSEELKAIYQQERMLQQPLRGPEAISSLSAAIHADHGAREAYDKWVRLCIQATGQSQQRNLASLIDALDRRETPLPPDGQLTFFPAYMTHEEHLIGRLLGTLPVPDPQVGEELIRQIRTNTATLTPTDQSGWYDYQTWALEPLLSQEKMPEAAHLHLADTYRRHLQDMFKEQLMLTREVHHRVEGAAAPRKAPPALHGNTPVVEITPQLTVEPCVSYYLRQAVSYRYIRAVLQGAFGLQALEEMRRPTLHGVASKSLYEELIEIEALFHGAHVLACEQLGLIPDESQKVGSTDGTAMDGARVAAWVGNLDGDDDLGQDTRIMIPMHYDNKHHKIKVWCFLGWASRPIRFYFFEQPGASVHDSANRKILEGDVKVVFGEAEHTLWYPVTAETWVESVPTPDQFRLHCDSHRQAADILSNLS